MRADCGHDCCPIRPNAYHAHRRRPQDCPACRIPEPDTDGSVDGAGKAPSALRRACLAALRSGALA
jgi:hypothetical protein